MNPSNPGSSASPSRISSAYPSAASLRPRTKRLISGLDELSSDLYSGSPAITPNYTPSESPFFSRVPSPIPNKHPSRSSSTNPQSRNTAISNEHGSDLAASLSGFWGKSWTSLQGLASNVLGSDATGEIVKDKTVQRTRRPIEATHASRRITSKQWGPAGLEFTQPGGGSKEERKALVIAKKREELLGSSTGLYSDNATHFKRRTSDDFDSASAPPGEHDDRDTLVYVYRVSSEDTLPGISIKFNCPLPTIKKANRLWSNDGIQFRKTIVIPVDACNVKGRRVAEPGGDQIDFQLGDGASETHVAHKHTSEHVGQHTRTASTTTITPSTAHSHINGALPITPSPKPSEEPWKHESWILLSGQHSAIEIGRLPRQDLGYFPRARRKSNSYSDLDTPSVSFDIPRPSITISDPATTERSVLQQQHRRRRSSDTQSFASQMIGPGGVGPLVGRGPSAPGPAEDKLNKVFGKHLPNIMPPPQLAPLPDDSELSTSGTSTPTLALENMGSAIEGWVRKLAKTAAKAVEPPSPNEQRGMAVGIRSGRGAGDLIELSDAFEIEDDGEDEEDGERDRERDLGLEEDERGRGRRADSSALERRSLAVRERAFGSGKCKGV